MYLQYVLIYYKISKVVGNGKYINNKIIMTYIKNILITHKNTMEGLLFFPIWIAFPFDNN